MNPPLACLLFLSGACALIYQTVWLREFRLVFGASTAATAAVLAIFMGGLGAGSWLLGKRAERAKSPLAFYATLEAIIAGLAAISPGLVWLARQAYFSLGGTMTLGLFGGTVLRLVLAAVVIGVPAFCMGGTLPAVARAETRTGDVGRRGATWGDVGRRGFAVLYGMNTLGAVTGVAVSTFFLFELLGNRLTLWSACVVNALVALIALGLSKWAQPENEPKAKRPARGETVTAVASPRFVFAAAAVAGFAFLLLELVWYRMLAPVLGGSTFTFGLILMTALFGMGLGSAAYAFSATRRVSVNAFAFVCALEALAIAIPYALGDRIAVLALLIQPLTAGGLWGQVLGWLAITCIVVLPASVVAGYQFPMLISLLGEGNEQIGRQTGLAYAWNTAGAIVGSLAGGLGCCPR